jgi:hypothetical protein
MTMVALNLVQTIAERNVDGTASRQWATRPNDQRYTSIDDLMSAVLDRRDRSTDTVMDLRSLRALNDGGELTFATRDNGRVEEWIPTNYAFQQLCQSIQAPASFIRTLPASLAADCLDHGLQRAPGRIQALTAGHELRGITGENYGRIWDVELVQAIKSVVDAGNGRWTVPTAFREANRPDIYPTVDPTTETTTLYASDRDVFLFLVDEQNPVQAGFLPDGSPDLFYRGFYAWNGECGGVSNGVATFLYRYVCQNRNIWGQKGFSRFSIKHTKHAAGRFASDLIPALTGFVDSSAAGLEHDLKAMKQARITSSDEDRFRFMGLQGFGPAESNKILARIVAEEGHAAETPFDYVQGITSVARSIPHQDVRIAYEQAGAKIMAQAMA